MGENNLQASEVPRNRKQSWNSLSLSPDSCFRTGAAQEGRVNPEAKLLCKSLRAEFFLWSDDEMVLPVSVGPQAWHLNRK